jgi:hypothetical protein
MKRFSTVTCAMLLLLSWSAAGQDKSASKNKSAPAGPSVVAADRGKFRILSNGQQVGVEEFSVAPNGAEWISKASVEIKAPDAGSAKVTGELRLAADGRPLGYQWTSQGAKKATGTIVFEGSTAEMELKVEGEQPFTQEFQFDTPQVAILDNNFYHHYGLLARMYDWNAKGVQTFSVLIPQDLATGKLTVEWAGPRDLDGIKAEMLRVRSSDLEIELFISGGRLVQVSVPISKAEIKRE